MVRTTRRSSTRSQTVEEKGEGTLEASGGTLPDRDDDQEDQEELRGTRSRKRGSGRLRRNDEEDDDDDDGDDDDDDFEKDSRQQKMRRSSSKGGAASGSGSGSRSRSKCSTGLNGITSDQPSGSQNSLEFSQSAQDARNVVASATATRAAELELQAKDEKKGSDLSPAVKAMLIKSMMRYLVMKGLNRDPATRKEMMAMVLGSAHRGKGILKYILGKASDALKKTVGFQLKTVPVDKPYYVRETYYVTNALNNGHHAKAILKGQEQASRGLLTVILCLIYCTTDKIIPEDELFKKLHDKVDKRIPAAPEAPGSRGTTRTKIRAHVEGLGDVHDHLATFVKQHYLKKVDTTRPTADGGVEPIVSYSMGARSHLEIGAQQVVTVMAEVMGQSVDPSALVELEDVMASQSQTQPQEASVG